jgi:PAT family beta-lactamase induction signal transducer AmpG
LICGIIILFNLGLLFIPEYGTNERIQAQKEDQNHLRKNIKISGYTGELISWISATIINPLYSFFKKNGVTIGLSIVGFIFLFKIGEAFLGRMSILFYKEMGFSKSDIALYSKGLGWITTVAFTLLGGWFAIKSGVIRALFISGIVMSLTNLMFTVMAWSDKSELLFAIAVLVDDLAAAFATVAFVTFISLLVDRNYTATQYALLASIGTAGRTLMASSSGSLVDWLEGDWGIFFIITALMVIPSLILLWIIRNKIFSSKN